MYFYHATLSIIGSILIPLFGFGATVSGTYTAGDIPTNNSSYSSTCNGPVTTLTINLPAGGPYIVSGVDVSYDMTAAGGAWMSEQQSQIYCQNTATDEGGYSSGSGLSGGTYSYSRTGLTLANNTYAGGTALVFEMRAYRTWTAAAGCNTGENKVDNGTWTITVTYTAATPMAYSSSTVTQNNTSTVATCASNQEIIGIEVTTTGTTSPIDLTQLRVRTNDSDDPLNDISNIDIYYTGTSSTFATTTLFGSAAPAAVGTNIFINGTQTLSSGTNYFWLVYDIAGTATIGNVLDARCTRVTVDGSNQTPTVTSPAGERTLVVCNGTPGGTSQSVHVWLRAGNSTTPSTGTGTLTAWGNSGAAGAITIFGSPTYDDNGYNFNPKIHFNGNGNYLGHSGVTMGSIYAVVELEDITRVYSHLSTWQNMCAGPHADGTLHGGITGTDAAYQLTTYSPEFEGAGVWKYNGISATHTNGYSGVHEVVSAVANSGDMDTYEDRLLGGQTCLPDRDWLGDVSEIVVLQGTSTAAERDQIESYLAVKFGITLGVNGTSIDYHGSDNAVIWDQSVNAGYNYDIAGVRRDDATELDQRKSHSENQTGGNYNDILTMANGTSFVSPTMIGVDKSSVIWGHDNGNLSGVFQSPTFSSTNSEVMESLFQRTWKAQEEGTMGTVTLQFDMNNIPGVSGSGTNDLANLRLLVDADGVFTSGALSIAPSTYNNTTNLVEFQHDFSSATGFYFSLGSVDYLNTPLPVELNDFSADCFNEGVLVKWQTELEINCDYFELQKSLDGKNWSSIAAINGAGNSITAKEYSFLDEATLEMNYYRLKQVDYNGHEIISKTILTRCGNNAGFDAFPNPFETELKIRTDLFLSKELKVELRNALGQLVHSEIFSDVTETVVVNLAPDLQSGTYFLSIIGQNRKFTQVVVKSS